MAEIIDKLQSSTNFIAVGRVTEQQIMLAEEKLGVHFANDYYAYVQVFGVAVAAGHEFTGICNSKRLNVVDVTLSEKGITPDVPHDWYVLEEANIDGIVIWQNSAGEVFQTQPGRKPIKIAASICDYLDLF